MLKFYLLVTIAIAGMPGEITLRDEPQPDLQTCLSAAAEVLHKEVDRMAAVSDVYQLSAACQIVRQPFGR